MERSDSSFTMASRAWSTTDLNLGLQHILTDGKNELPDDIAQLQVHCSLPQLFLKGSEIYEMFLNIKYWICIEWWLYYKHIIF